MIKKSWTKIFTLAMVLFMSMNAVSVYANDKELKVFLRGEEAHLQGKPFIQDSVLYLPMREIFEAMGYSVEWDETNYSAVAEKQFTSIKVKVIIEVDKYQELSEILIKRSALDGEDKSEIFVKTATEIRDGRIFLPFRIFSDGLGMKMDYTDGVLKVEPYDYVIQDEDEFSNNASQNDIIEFLEDTLEDVFSQFPETSVELN